MEKSAKQSIRYKNRYTGKMETERVYGERWLRWTYHTLSGRFLLWLLIKRACFSRYYGRKMKRSASKAKIMPFIREYAIDTLDMANKPTSFSCFNDFFIRKLKADARPIDPAMDIAVMPADGRHLVLPDLSKVEQVFVKGQVFDLDQLLIDDGLTGRYRRGSLLLSRLCPIDYHRFHFPVSGYYKNTTEVAGPLYSVNPLALRHNLSYLTGNKRMISEVLSSIFGPVLMIEVGATCVGSIVQTSPTDVQVAKGQEKGYFEFGGSTIITLFEPTSVHFAEDLLENSNRGFETYVRMGDILGYRP